jgi:flagella basal body P-ring formation protein FlgA
MSLLLLTAWLGGAAAASPNSCVRMVRPLAADTIVTKGDLADSPCEGGRPLPAFRYDPAVRAARAARDLAAGELVTALPPSALPSVRPGQTLTLSVQIGAVSLTRTVVALQPCRTGEKLFVRGADGRVFAADCPEIRT